ncbi:MAG TPA: carboxypeptidase-like regulatory domain-containing protein [Candidatus Limnocylindrales bacterium]|nr:carboxypeptidase-like regulatory domain-containing protein [Candidatus Limnocylindrales bacterium]
MHTALLALIATLVLACCQAPGAGQAITGIVTAGPVCPVVTEPPDPACDDRPVAGAEIVVRDAAGETVARVRTAEDGTFSVSLASGSYELVPQPVEGLMGTASPVGITVEDGLPVVPIEISYDTGIR